MNILFCTNAFAQVSNGPAKFAHLLLAINEKHAPHQLRILTEDHGGSDQTHVYPLVLKIPKVFRPLGMFIRMFAYHREAMRIRKSGYQFDVLVYNNAIVSLRSAISFRNTFGFINDDNNASVSAKDGIFRYSWLHGQIFFITEWLATRLCKRVIVNSNYLLRYLQKRYTPAPNKLACLYKAIELPAETMTRKNEVPEILFVKNDYARGGLSTLIQSLKMLNIPVVLHVAGPPEKAAHMIRTQCADSHILLQFHGIIPQGSVYNLMRSADVFCVPSHREALGVANIEALALGCAVVSSTAGGIPEVLADGRYGWLVQPNDPVGLAQALQEAITNTAMRMEKIRLGQESLSRFTTDVMIKQFLAILSGNEH